MEDTVKKVRNYAWKTFAVLSVGAVIHLIVSDFTIKSVSTSAKPNFTEVIPYFRRIQKIAKNIFNKWQHFAVYLPPITSS